MEIFLSLFIPFSIVALTLIIRDTIKQNYKLKLIKHGVVLEKIIESDWNSEPNKVYKRYVLEVSKDRTKVRYVDERDYNMNKNNFYIPTRIIKECDLSHQFIDKYHILTSEEAKEGFNNLIKILDEKNIWKCNDNKKH